jgi:hypothetical protein
MINRSVPHVLVLPEDDANRQLANGFVLDPDLDDRKIQILPEAGGWTRVLEQFKTELVPEMRRFPRRHVVLLIDFDERPDRRSEVQGIIPEDLKARVHVLGTWNEPERMKSRLRMPFESIGVELARNCRSDLPGLWSEDELRHNEADLIRLREAVRPILFLSGS